MKYFWEWMLHGVLSESRARRWSLCLLEWALFLADRFPWFLRKPSINYLVGREVLSDFCQADQLGQLGDFAPICIKW